MDNNMRYRVTNTIDGSLSEVVFKESSRDIVRQSIRPTRHYRKKRVLVAVLVVFILTVTGSALAWYHRSAISAWLADRFDSMSMSYHQDNDLESNKSLVAADLQGISMRIELFEAIADARVLTAGLRIITTEARAQIDFYDDSIDLERHARDKQSSDPVYMVTAELVSGAGNHEFYHLQKPGEGEMIFLAELRHQSHSAAVDAAMNVAVVYLKGETIIREKLQIPFTVDITDVIDIVHIQEPIHFEHSNIVITRLGFEKTALRTYADIEVDTRYQTLPFAVRNLDVIFYDQDGAVIQPYQEYGQAFPQNIRAELVDIDTGEVMERLLFIRREGLYVLEKNEGGNGTW